ncbi:MAG: hypothetical protein ACRDHZ_03400 [Ktedonobacteraceae bacterium]
MFALLCSPRNPESSIKLHSPDHCIVGGGFFSHYTVLPASFAWTTFGPKNGVTTEDEMRRRIERYRRVDSNASADYSVGCILLQYPFVLSREECLPVPDWRREVVRGKGYATDDEVGENAWRSAWREDWGGTK